jgi:hypothetical protein
MVVKKVLTDNAASNETDLRVDLIHALTITYYNNSNIKDKLNRLQDIHQVTSQTPVDPERKISV